MMASTLIVKSPKNLVLLLLTLTTVGGALLAWRQYAELVELRAIAMNRDERTDFQKRIWDLEKANKDLLDQLAARGGAGDLATMVADVTEERPDDNRRRGENGRGDNGRGRGGPPNFTAMRELMNKPEVQAMIAQQQKAALDARYGALFRNLNLSPADAEKLKTLLLERQASRQDVYEAARAQGIDPRQNPEAFRKLMTDARNEVENSIKSVLGDSGYAQLQNYEQTMPQRGLVNELQQRLSYTNTPLTASQADQLVQILAANTPPRPTPPTAATTASGTDRPREGGMFFDRGPGGPGFGPPRGGPDLGMLFGGPGGGFVGAVLEGGRGPGAVPVTDNAVVQAQTVLSQPQVAALKQVQQQQQTQQQLAQMVRETMSTAATTSTTSAGAASGASGKSGTPSGNQPPSRRGRGGG